MLPSRPLLTHPGPLRIDAHHHLWRYTPEEYPWIDDSMAAIRQDFALTDLHAAMAQAGVVGSVAVQARSTEEETHWLLQLAEEDPAVLGVVGWLPIASDGFAKALERFLPHAKFKGLRHIVQAETPGFLDGEHFNAGIRQLTSTGLTYDILIVASQLKEAIRFVSQHPRQTFVLDHLAKPNIRTAELQPWANDLQELARHPHITCKISGMVTEANPQSWTEANLRPYFDVALEAFGPRRLMAGSDWPVVTVGCSYTRWWQLVQAWIAALSVDEQRAILGQTAARVYGLNVSALAQSNASVAQVAN